MSNIDPLDLVALEQRDAASKEASKQADRQERDDFMWLMSFKQGRRIIAGLLERSGIFRCSYSGNNSDTIFREGMRNVGLYYLGQIEAHCPEMLHKIITEKNPK